MIKNVIQFVKIGRNIVWRSGTLVGKSTHSNVVQLITDESITDIAQVTVSIKDSVDLDKYQYLIPTSYKGGDVLSTSNPYYQDVALYNVFEVELKKELVSVVSKFRTGRVAFSFSFVSIEPSANSITYKGKFGLNTPLPTTGQVLGDYYECEDYNYVLSGVTYSKGMFVVWNGTSFVADWFYFETTTEPIDVPIQPAVSGTYELTTDERNYLASIGADVALHNIAISAIQQDITDMKDGTDAFSEILLGTAQIRYNATKKIVEQVFDDGTTLEVGLELWAIARNEDSTILKNGEVAAINGVVGQQLSVVHADPSDDNLHFKELGVCTMDSNIAVNGTGKITHFGEVNGIPIANFEVTGVPYAENQELYVSVNGKLTNVQPAKPITHIHAGWILRTIGSNANIFVYFVKVPHFDHLSDVIITTPTNGDIPILGSDGIWRNSQRLVTAEGKITTLEGKVQTLETLATTIYDFKGSVAFESLPTTGQKVGDAYNITNNFTLGGQDYLAGTNVAWNGTTWDALASRIPNGDEVEYSSGVSVNEKIDTKSDKTYVDAQDQILDDRIDTIIAGTVEGVSGAEIVDARGGYTVLGDKIDAIDNTIEQHEYYKVFRNNKIVPCVTFIDDDGSSQVYTALKPIFDSKNIKGNLSIIAGFLDTTNFLTRVQLDELYNDGWAILGHTYDVLTNLGDPLYANDNDLKYQIYDGCKLLLESYGYEVDGFVYPQSVSDFRIRNMTKLYYDYSFSKLGINDDTLMDTMQIRRISIGSLDNPTINGNSDSNTLDYYKACVDYAVTNNSWIAFTTHIATTDTTQRQHLADLIDYIKSLNVLITDTKTAHKIHSNKVFIGDVEDGTYSIISKNGKLYSSNQIFYPLELNAYASATLIEEYPYGISVFYVNNLGNSGYPKNASGIVQTYKVGALSGYYYQEYKRYLSPEKFIRYVNSDGSWSIWEEITDIRVLESNKYNLTNVPNDFRLGVTSCTVSDSNTSWGTSPFIALGTLVNYKLSTSGNETYQEYFVRGQSVNWRRVWNPVTTQWGAWFQLVGHSGTTANRPTTVNIGYSYFDTTLGKPIWWKGTVWVDATGTTV